MPAPNTQTPWNIPYQRNPFFTGREDVLTQLHRALQADATVALSHPQGISGLGGIGKTQTALEYAYRYRSDYKAIFWVRADSITSLTSSMAELAHVLELPERNEQDQKIIVEAVLRWLHLHSGWLLIYDNIDDLSVAEPFLPKTGAGHLLFTTRTYALGGLAERLDIQKMEPETGALLLLRRASLLTLQAALGLASPDDQDLARAISEELDGFPLALDQAGAYIKEAPCPLPDYLTRYQAHRSDILRTRGSFDQDYPASVTTTWSLSFEKVSQSNPAATELLDLCAFLAPDAIPEEMITGAIQYLSPSLQTIASHPVLLDQTVRSLLAFSLIGRNADNTTLNMHRLVQTVLRDKMDGETPQKWIKCNVRILDHLFPAGDMRIDQWRFCERLVSHVLASAAFSKGWEIITPETAILFHNAAIYLLNRAQYNEAEPLFQQTLAAHERLFGSDHLDTTGPLNNLANLYREQGKLEEAEAYYQKVLTIRKKILSHDHPEVATTLNNLAILYHDQGLYKQAKVLYQQALDIREKALGPDHPLIASTLNSLASLYHDLRQYEQAEALYQRAIEIQKQAEGPNHPNVAISLNNLGILYKSQRKYQEAELLYKQALAIYEETVGPDHPDTAYSIFHLATLYRAQGQFEQAEQLYQQAQHIWEQALGPYHAQVAYALNNLASLYYEHERNEQALPLFQQALAIREQSLGPNHPEVAHPLNNLASLYRALNEDEQAEPLYRRALSIWEQALGSEHFLLTYPLKGLAGIYQERGQYQQAGVLYQRILEIYANALEPDHPDIALPAHELAIIYTTQSQYTQAEPLYQQALAIREQQLGPTHADTQKTLKAYAAFLRLVGRDTEAETLEVKHV